jgi:hypothetical protein
MDVKHHERTPPLRFGQVSYFAQTQASFVRLTAAGSECGLTSWVCACVRQSRPIVFSNESALPAFNTMARGPRIPALSPKCSSFVAPATASLAQAQAGAVNLRQ